MQENSLSKLQRRTYVAAMLCAASLAACGGGGGGSGGNPAEPPAALPRAWAGAASLELGVFGADDPQIAIDAQGNAMAVWTQQASSALLSDVWAARYVPGSGWESPQRIETGTGNSFSPQVAMDANGNAVAVWLQAAGAGEEDVFANRYVAGSGWGQAQLVSNLSELGEANEVQIAMDASGNALVIWRQTDSQTLDQNLWFNRYTTRSGWGTPDLLERVPGDARSPQIASTASGTAMAIWRQENEAGTRTSIMASRYQPSSGWATPELVEKDDSGDAFDPQVALDANGNAMAVWGQFDGLRHNIWANRFAATGQWGTPERLEKDTNRAFDPHIAMDAQGNAIAVWEQELKPDSEGTFNIWANRFDGTRWGSAEKIQTGSDKSAEPKVALDASGNALAVWVQSDGGETLGVRSARLVPGAAWSTPERLEAVSNAQSREPKIASNASGIAVAVWAREVASVGSIFANVFK
jgi:hypothetical protein